MSPSEDQARAFCAQRTDQEGLERLERFAAMLARENERQNLVSTASLAAVWQRHFADSLQLLDHVPRGTGPWLDLGSGAGFPGLVLALAQPSHSMVLVESRKRRVDWLSRVVVEFGLQSCHILGARLESVESFAASVISARAFAPLGKLLSLSARFSTQATVWVLPKGRSAAQELAEQPAPIRALFHVERSRTDDSGGIIVGRGIPVLHDHDRDS